MPGPSKIYFPTIESCWDYGIVRNDPLIPVLGDLLPYQFLRGTQFDTKVFKLWDIVNGVKNSLKEGGDLFSTGSTQRNEVIFELEGETARKLREQKPGTTTKTVTSSDGIPTTTIKINSGTSEDQIAAENSNSGTFLHLAVEGDSDLSIKISNKWGGGEDILTQAIQGVADIAKNSLEIFRSLTNVAGESDNFAGVPFSPMRYKGTDFGTITLNFMLFTRNNYIRDIHKPLMILKNLCLAIDKPWAKDFQDAAQKNDLVKMLKAKAKEKLTKQQIDKAVEDIQGALKFMNERYRVVQPPPTFRVTHSGNMFFMKKAAIVDFSYKPEGPWVRVEYDGLFGETMGGLGVNSQVGTALDRLVQDEYVKFPNYPKNTYPTRVKCSITLQETDFVTLTDYAKRDFGVFSPQIITGTASQVANSLNSTNSVTASQIAGGIAQNIGTVVPNTPGVGTLLSGGNWIPPGESSVTGIPSFL